MIFSSKSDPYRKSLARLKPALWGVAGFSAIVNVLMLTGSIYMMQVYDRVLSSGSVPTLVGLFTIVVVLYAFLGMPNKTNRACWLKFDQQPFQEEKLTKDYY